MYTPTHKSAEVWKENTWGFASDIWSLGCTFFEMNYLCFTMPYDYLL
jgi:hypothetical protein